MEFKPNNLHVLWNPEVQFLIHKGSPIIPILSRINPIPRNDIYLRSILWSKIRCADLLKYIFFILILHYYTFMIPPGPSSIENDVHVIEKLLLKIEVSEKFLHSEVKCI